ncbi:neuropeptide-like protein C4orf48 homolog isoform X1 [Corvus kubaryi]|uniref:neuropeptide-like protein C4orf48 homolog isoform X1 n=1 Tax=Corvus kubaryi TaxID=68294 RepID=UPI001C040715|nr:neuropeptide-like protein C4orf48 homolog isoform X1 [Corvus kubaryi]
MAMTLIREEGMQKGRMLRVAAGVLPARYSCSKGLAHRRRERSGTGQTGPWGASRAHGVSRQWQGRQLELLMRAMALPSVWSEMRVGILLLSVLSLLSAGLVGAGQDSGSVIPAESRPCVDCHAFEFMQRALQDLKKTAYNLDTRTETLLLRAEKRGLCDCFRAIH